MTRLRERLSAPESSIPMLVIAGTVCVLAMLVAGGLVYGNTRRTITAADWVEHTQEVLRSLQNASQLNQRIEYSSRLYLTTGDADQLDDARESASSLEDAASHLGALVVDNAGQASYTRQLTVCAAELSKAVDILSPKADLPRNEIQHCDEAISSMTEREQRLLTERSETSQKISVISLTTEFVFVVVSLLTLIALFAFLLRGAQLRQRSDKRILQTNRNLEQSIQLLRDQANESALLTSSRDELQLCVNLEEVYKAATNSFARLLPGTSGALCMITNSRNMMECASSWGDTAIEDCQPPESCCGLRSGQPRWRQPGVSEIHCSHFASQAPEYYLCMPVVAYGDTLGLLYLQCKDEAGMLAIRQHMDGLHQLVQLTGMATASMRLRIKLENQSIRDPLTTLFNRHFMEIALDRELSRATRRKTMLAVLMLDVDHFKEFNDVHGHAAGDAVLKAVAAVCQNTIRVEDTACRYGGEEFTIILPEIAPEAAVERAENIRAAIANLRVSQGKDFYGEVTMSIGIALYPDDGTTAEILLRKADQALYRAKQQGRNQVVLSAQLTFVA